MKHLLQGILVAVFTAFPFGAFAAPEMRLPFCDGSWYVYPGSSYHNSFEIDFNKYGSSSSADCGSRVVAPAGGKVVLAKYDSICGNQVKIDHGSGYTSEFCHLSSMKVGVGSQLAQGDDVGAVGDTGSGANSCHLHFGARKDGGIIVANFVESGPLNGASPGIYNFNAGDSLVSQNFCDGTGPPSPGPIPGPPPPGSRRFPVGSGTLNPYAWEQGSLDGGGVPVLGVAVETPRWDTGDVVQRLCRLDDKVCNLLVHDQNGGAPRAIPVIDAFYSAYVQFGGIGRLGAPISRKYQLAGSNAWRQDFQYGYIVIDGNGPHNYLYPSGHTPGVNASNKNQFEVAYAELSGNNNIGNPTGTVTVSSGVEWQSYKAVSGATSKLVAIPGYIRAFQLKGAILATFNAGGGVGVFGPPLSDEVDLGNKQKRQFFRFATFNYNGNTGVTTVTKTARQYAPGETVTPSSTNAQYLRDAFERNGSYAKLGICTFPYYGAGHVYQYCSGGTSNGRAAVILNSSASNYVAFVVRAGIEGYYASQGGISGVMGTPVSDEYIPVSGTTRQDFGHKRMAWYSYQPHVSSWEHEIAPGEGTGYPIAFEFSWNLDRAHLGAPKNGGHWWQYRSGTSMLQDFDGGSYNGTITFLHDQPSRAPRAFILRGGVRTAYFNVGGPDSFLGRPITDEVVQGLYTRQYFEGGYIDGNTSAAVYTSRPY